MDIIYTAQRIDWVEIYIGAMNNDHKMIILYFANNIHQRLKTLGG
jgi:hypothetical protein